MSMLKVFKDDLENFDSILKCGDSLQHLFPLEVVSEEFFEVERLELIFFLI